MSTKPEAGTDGRRRAHERPAALWVARTRLALAIGSLAAVAGLTYVRLYYGVDFTDESFYTAALTGSSSEHGH